MTLIDALDDLAAADAATAFSSEQPTPEPTPEPEAPARRQPGMRVECWVAGHSPYPLTVTVLNPDRIRYEKTLARHQEWPQNTTSFAMTFLTWTAAVRAGLTTLPFAQWETALEDWEKAADLPVDPTR